MALFAAGMTLTPDGGALVVVEKRPRKIGTRRDSTGFIEDVFEDVLRIVGAAQLCGTVGEMVGEICARLNEPPLQGDVWGRVDLSTVGASVLPLFWKGSVRPSVVLVGGESTSFDKSAVEAIPSTELQGVITMLLQSGRLEVVASLVDGSAILRGIEALADLPAVGPSRDLGMAAAIGLWAAYKTPSRDGWASNKPRPDAEEREWMRSAKRRALEAAKASAHRSLLARVRGRGA